MREARQLAGYFLTLMLLGALFAVGTQYAVVEAAQYLHVTSPEPNRLARGPELAAEPTFRAADANPVWIAPTAKYQYDPRLMVVKSKEERQKEVELRRAKELAAYEANKREAQLRRDRNLRQARESFAYAPEQRRPDFQVYPFNIQ